MNERIRELYVEATGKDWAYDFDPEVAEKFAELIVRECMTKVSEWDMGIDDPVGATDNTSEVARDMVAEIKQHFGVEE
jgi:hypothetical protein